MNRASRRHTAKISRTSEAQSLPPEAHRLFQETVGHHQAKRFQQAEAGYDTILSQLPPPIPIRFIYEDFSVTNKGNMDWP